MPHFLLKRTEDDGKPHMYVNPFLVSMRYQCGCTEGEVLKIQTVFDLDSFKSNEDEEAFIWAMKRMFRYMKIEIAQHMNKKEKE